MIILLNKTLELSVGLGLNHVVRKQSETLDSHANFLIPVPGGSFVHPLSLSPSLPLSLCFSLSTLSLSVTLSLTFSHIILFFFSDLRSLAFSLIIFFLQTLSVDFFHRVHVLSFLPRPAFFRRYICPALQMSFFVLSLI
jgi:hypothetical protein